MVVTLPLQVAFVHPADYVGEDPYHSIVQFLLFSIQNDFRPGDRADRLTEVPLAGQIVEREQVQLVPAEQLGLVVEELLRAATCPSGLLVLA